MRHSVVYTTGSIVDRSGCVAHKAILTPMKRNVVSHQSKNNQRGLGWLGAIRQSGIFKGPCDLSPSPVVTLSTGEGE